MEIHDLLREHLIKIHGDSKAGDIQIEVRHILRDLAIQKCPFCDQVPGVNAFVGHICHHLEEISLSSIPKEEDDIDENEELGIMSRQPSFPASSISPSNGGSVENEVMAAVETDTPGEEEQQGKPMKTAAQIRLEIIEKVKAAAEAGRVKSQEQIGNENQGEVKTDAELEDIERHIREIEEADAEREKKEAEFLARRRVLEKTEKTDIEKIKAAENDRKLKEGEREMERLEDEREKKKKSRAGRSD
jgi:hypothetical protein